MFEIGFWELALIAVIALLVLGPERLPEAARTVGAWVARARRFVRSMTDELEREADIKGFREDLDKSRRNFQDQWSDLDETVRGTDTDGSRPASGDSDSAASKTKTEKTAGPAAADAAEPATNGDDTSRARATVDEPAPDDAGKHEGPVKAEGQSTREHERNV